MRLLIGAVLALSASALLGQASCKAEREPADAPGTDVVPASDVPSVDTPAPDLPFPDVPPDVAAPVDASPDVAAPVDVPPEVTIPSVLGGDRPADLFVPDDYDARKAWPLLILLHGYTASGFMQDAYLNLSPRVTELGFVFLRPDGTMNSKGFLFWNASPSCCDFEGADVDDVAYIRGLVAEAKAALNIDPDRVFLIGHSNGGFMSLRMACDASDQVSGILSLAGSISRETVAAGGCTPGRPVSVVLVHGTLDDSIRYAGTSGGAHPYLSAEETRDLWKGLDQCPGDPVAGTAADLDTEVEGAETTPAGWTGCAGGTSVALWTMAESGHIPLFGEAGQDAVLRTVLGMRRDPAPGR